MQYAVGTRFSQSHHYSTNNLASWPTTRNQWNTINLSGMGSFGKVIKNINIVRSVKIVSIVKIDIGLRRYLV